MFIELKNVNKNFGDLEVLKNINILLKTKQRHCVLGESGCGKTTLLNIIMGLTQQDSGEIIGINKNKLSVIFQEDRLCENLTVERNISLVLKQISKRDLIFKFIQNVGLVGWEKEYVKNLSGGMKRRVSILRALLYPYDLLIMDEPFKGLDETTKDKVIKFVEEETKNKTVLWVTHDKEELSKLPSKIIYL